MHTMSDDRFVELATALRDSPFGACSRHKVTAACRGLGWTVDGDEVTIPDTPSGGWLLDDDDSRYPGATTVELRIGIGVIEPEKFRRYLDLLKVCWGTPTWYYGADGLSVCWSDGSTVRHLAVDFAGNLDLSIGSEGSLLEKIGDVGEGQELYLDELDEEAGITTADGEEALSSTYHYDTYYTWCGWHGDGNGALVKIWRHTHFSTYAHCSLVCSAMSTSQCAPWGREKTAFGSLFHRPSRDRTEVSGSKCHSRNHVWKPTAPIRPAHT